MMATPKSDPADFTEVLRPEQLKYLGAAWRSRFLRAPKVALVLARRPDFVALGELAKVSLGLKTGADKFFFLRPEPTSPQYPAQRGQTRVKGYEGWTGYLANQDLIPALVGPAQLDQGGGRRFVVPKNTGRLYVFPRPGRLRADIAEYIHLGELAAVSKQSLVLQNAAGGDWYRQTRSLVRDPWALPYNSAYDYGAWDNAAGAVLNGRFIGVRPLEGIDNDLLGAVLNSTFAALGRLTEGMATGTEGAFDAGPPAVRGIRVPNIRNIDATHREHIIDILDEVRKSDTMLPGPDGHASVPPLRRRLDEAFLRALGLSAGQAAVQLDTMYASYARWRRDVSEVEQQMRRNRRQLSRSGRSRSTDPIVSAGRRVWEEVAHQFKIFPSEYLVTDDELEEVTLPKGVTFPDHPRLIEPGVLSDGAHRLDLGSHERMRYAAMLSIIGFTGPLCIPKDSIKAGSIARLFAEAGSTLREAAKKKAVAYVGREAADRAAKVTVDSWLRACRRAGMVSEAIQPDATPTILPPVAGK